MTKGIISRVRLTCRSVAVPGVRFDSPQVAQLPADMRH